MTDPSTRSVLTTTLDTISRVFDVLDEWWESVRVQKMAGTVLVLLFVGALIVIELARLGWIPPTLGIPTNHFAAIALAFTALLVIEVIGLVLALARSVAEAAGKQFELFSLILIREAFKELGTLGEPIEWASASEPVLNALVAAGGGLVIFAGSVLYKRLQRHRPITSGGPEQARFVAAKKAIAVALLVAFVVAGVDDATRYITGRNPYPFFDAFFTALIFADVLVVLVSLRYTTTYAVVFRNAGLALATVLLRIALIAPVYAEVGLAIGATTFGILLTVGYNWARRDEEEVEAESARLGTEAEEET
ncbi:MAG: hypothetical protein AAGI52_12310 [Bacteroidota bacterium]